MKNFCIFLFIFIVFITTIPIRVAAQITGKFGTYYDQRELLFESLPTATSDIIFLGNSITDGSEWPELFQNPHCKNRGISGDIIPGVLNRLETVTKGQPAMVFLMIGTNDMNHGASNDSIALGVRAIVQRIKTESPDTRIIVQSILPTNDCYGLFTGHTKRWQDVAVINNMLRTMAIEEGVDYLDLYHPFATAEGKMNTEYSNDGLHLNGKGYALWKTLVEQTYGTFPRPVYQSGRVPVWLTSSTGLNVIENLDLGASPLRYIGGGLNLSPGVLVEWDRYHLQFDNRILANICFNKEITQTFVFGFDSRIEFLYRCLDTYNNRLHLWAGGIGQTYLDIKYYPQLMNAAIGMSTFINLHATGMIQYDFARRYDHEHSLFTLYGKLSLPMFGFADRPGFSYMDNYTSNLNTGETLIKNRDDFGILFPGINTEIGLFLNLLNNNKIGLSYRWDYLTTRHKGIHRFDHAAHTFNLIYLFHIN